MARAGGLRERLWDEGRQYVEGLQRCFESRRRSEGCAALRSSAAGDQRHLAAGRNLRGRGLAGHRVLRNTTAGVPQNVPRRCHSASVRTTRFGVCWGSWIGRSPSACLFTWTQALCAAVGGKGSDSSCGCQESSDINSPRSTRRAGGTNPNSTDFSLIRFSQLRQPAPS